MDHISPSKNNDLDVRLPGMIDNKAVSKDFVDIGQVVKRTERISSALYLVTGYFPENDPLTLKIREVSVSLLSLMSHFILESRRGIIGRSKDAHRMVLELVSLFDTARLAGFVSEMNFNIISDEIEKVVTALRTIVDSEGTSMLVDKHFFSIPEVPVPAKNEASSTTSQTQEARSNKAPATRVSHVPNGSVDIKKKSRREAILSAVKKQGEVGIKEIASAVKNCSEKTVQRELTALVNEGILKKKGDRRWSMYLLA